MSDISLDVPSATYDRIRRAIESDESPVGILRGMERRVELDPNLLLIAAPDCDVQGHALRVNAGHPCGRGSGGAGVDLCEEQQIVLVLVIHVVDNPGRIFLGKDVITLLHRLTQEGLVTGQCTLRWIS